MTLDLTFGGSLRIPLIAAPMFLVSSPEMALAACSRGVMGSFPAHSTRTRAVFAGWLDQMTRGRTRYKRIFSAGQGVGMVNEVQTTAELCDELIAQYREARVAVRERLGGSAVVGTAACGGRPERRRA